MHRSTSRPPCSATVLLNSQGPRPPPIPIRPAGRAGSRRGRHAQTPVAMFRLRWDWGRTVSPFFSSTAVSPRGVQAAEMGAGAGKGELEGTGWTVSEAPNSHRLIKGAPRHTPCRIALACVQSMPSKHRRASTFRMWGPRYLTTGQPRPDWPIASGKVVGSAPPPPDQPFERISREDCLRVRRCPFAARFCTRGQKCAPRTVQRQGGILRF